MTPRTPRAPGPPATVEEALRRAAEHGERALAEAVLAARALLDALSLALHGAPSEERRVLGLVARGLDELARTLADGPEPGALLQAVAEALDAEITRWERRASEDADARAVLRAYLGLREILWELGVRADPRRRPRPEPAASATGSGAKPPAPKRRPGGRGRRVQRVPVEG